MMSPLPTLPFWIPAKQIAAQKGGCVDLPAEERGDARDGEDDALSRRGPGTSGAIRGVSARHDRAWHNSSVGDGDLRPEVGRDKDAALVPSGTDTVMTTAVGHVANTQHAVRGGEL